MGRPEARVRPRRAARPRSRVRHERRRAGRGRERAGGRGRAEPALQLSVPQLTDAARRIKGKVAFHWLESADHGYRPLKASGRTSPEVLDDVARVATEWVCHLPG